MTSKRCTVTSHSNNHQQLVQTDGVPTGFILHRLFIITGITVCLDIFMCYGVCTIFCLGAFTQICTVQIRSFAAAPSKKTLCFSTFAFHQVNHRLRCWELSSHDRHPFLLTECPAIALRTWKARTLYDIVVPNNHLVMYTQNSPMKGRLCGKKFF